MEPIIGRKHVVIWIGIFLGIFGTAYGIYDSANIGIKTKTHRHDPEQITNTYGQDQSLSLPQTISYHRTATIERLSPVYSSSSNSYGSSSSSSSSSHSSNEYHPSTILQPPLPQQEQHQYQPSTLLQPPAEAQQGNAHYQYTEQKQQYSQHQQQQQQQQQPQQQQNQEHNEYNRQQEIPLYERNTATHTVSSKWNDAENTITEYYTGCPAGHTGQLPYAYDCRRFLNCWHGRGHIQSCGAGTVFNPETLECDRPDKVSCGDLGLVGEAVQANRAKYRQDHQHQHQHQVGTKNYRSERLVDAPVENVELLCPHGISGLQPHPHNCSKFINCANGNIHVQECGPGTAYSIPMMICDYKEKVDCSGRDYTYGVGLLDVRMIQTNSVGSTGILVLNPFSKPNSSLCNVDSEDSLSASKNYTKNSDVTCPLGASGLYPHPFDCTKFLNCVKGVTTIQNCGPGTAFDSVNKVCGFLQDHCADQSVTVGTSSSGSGSTAENGWTNTINHGSLGGHTTTVETHFGVDILCPTGVSGLFVHPFDYTKFLNCRNGVTAVQNCVTGTIFSISKGFCELREKVEFTDHVSYIVSEVSYEYSKMLMSCPPGTEGLHLYPYDCTKYINCSSNGRLLIQECPSDSVFSISRHKCHPKHQVTQYDRVKYFYELSQSRTTTTHVISGFSTTSISSSNNMIGCPLGVRGNFPYPFDNIKYVLCHDGKLSIETCSSGTAFSLSKKQCLLKDGLKPNDMVLFRREFAEEWSLEVGYGYGYSPGNLYLVCPPKIDDGIFLHPFDCTKYMKCENGTTRIENCPSGTVFSISREQCINRDQVEVNDRVEYLTDLQHELTRELNYNANQPGSVVCPENAIGLYPHPFDSRKYLRCKPDTTTIVESCKPGMYFSISGRFCGMENQVPVNDRSGYGRSHAYTQDTSSVGIHETTESHHHRISCPSGASGMFPHPYDCTKFLNCANGVGHIQNCGPGTAWSKDMEVCDFKDKVDCTGRNSDVHGTNSQEIFTSKQEGTPTGTNHKVECPPGIRDGYFPHPFDYTKYFSCDHGRSTLNRCINGSVFSISSRSCAPTEKVNVRDRVTLLMEFLTETNVELTQSYGFITCPGRASGLYVYPFDCTKYIRCDYGHTVIESCTPGTVFSMNSQICMPQDQVDRIDRVAFITEMDITTQHWQSSREHRFNSQYGFLSSRLVPSRASYTSPSSSKYHVSCPSGASGMHPHPYDCTKFLNCANGETHIQSCGPGTAWSKDMEVCESIDKVDCTGRLSSVEPFDQQQTVPNTDRIICPMDIGDGFYPHPFDYAKYFICQHGQSLIGYCGRGNAFSISRRICDASERVTVTDRVTLTMGSMSESDIRSIRNDGFVTCPAKAAGDFLYPFDCTKYVKCNHGRTLIEFCPQDTVFSMTNRNCLPKSRVERMDRVAFIAETQTDLYYWQNNEASTVVLCPIGVTGYFQHPSDWTKYLDCSNGQALVRACPAGTVFSVSRGICEQEAKVSIDDRCHSDKRAISTSGSGSWKYGLETEQNAAIILEPSTPKCPTGANGMFPHPFDCEKFLNCANGVAHIHFCSPGTAWNPAINSCDYKHKVDCSDRSGEPHAAKLSTPQSEGLRVKCPVGASGMLPHPYDCTKFLNCANGVTHIQACGPGTAWSRDMEVCDFIGNVDCSNLGDSNYYSNRVSKSYGGGVTTTNQWNHDTHGHTYGDKQHTIGGNTGSATTTTQYTDRWSNMNMRRPDTSSYGSGSSTWTGRQNQDAIYSGHNEQRPTITADTDTNWSAVGSSVDRQTPAQNVLYMEGSLEPNRNYVNTFHTYTAPLAPLSSNTATDFTSTTTTTGTTKIYYAQPVESQESIDKPYGHNAGGSTNPLPLQNRQSHSRTINQMSNSNSWAPVVRHENTLETHTAQLPNQQLMPPHNTPISISQDRPPINLPTSHLMPPPSSSDRGQKPLDFGDISFDRGQIETSGYDQAQSASDRRPVVSVLPPDQSNAFGGLQPPTLSTSTSTWNQQNSNFTKPRPFVPNGESNLYGGLQPPNSDPYPPLHTTPSSVLEPPIQTNTTNVRVYQIYPPLHNTTSINSYGNPHYSSPYSGVAHSRNATWISTRLANDISERNPLHLDSNNRFPPLATTTTTTLERKSVSMPPSYNHRYYKSTTSSEPQEVATDLVDTQLPISDALRMLLRPYFNRSGTVNDDTAKEAESHIMRLVVDGQYSTTTPIPVFLPRAGTSATPPTTSIADAEDRQKQTQEDVELILAGEQHSLINTTTKIGSREVRTEVHTTQENSNHSPNWHRGINHSREFHLRHPNLPSPFSKDPKQADFNDAKNQHQHQHKHTSPPPNHHWHEHNHHPHHHSRDFHLRHPDMPNPFSTKEGDNSKAETDLTSFPNPYAEPTTPSIPINPSTRFLGTSDNCQFDCGNGKYVKRFEVCDGVNNCGNRKDESNCDHLGYEVRLTGGESPHMGRVEVKIRGKWGYVCDDKFGLRDADVVCRELGFNLGASEIRGNSYYPPSEANFGFAMDEVDCHGNETTLKDCNFKGWGIHNCGPDEVVGVVCKVPLFKCPNNYWLCSTSKECIPPAFVCDNTPDCSDQSDESEQVCKSPIQYRLEGGRNTNEGRLEVKYRGEWGTVCDDDFGIKEAQVVCNSLGYYGKPEIQKNIYGPGSGPIWLDQVSCLGNETSIDKCNHWIWGEHNCNHTEDVGIRCTAGPPPRHLRKYNTEDDDGQRQTPFDDTEFYQGTLERSSKFLRSQDNCGHFKQNIFDEYAHPEERVVNGTIAKRGRHPWQATIRTRGRGGISSHWCGAVLIADGSSRQSSHLLTAAHCLAGYQKGAYFVRMGDHYANIAEASEIDSFIENWYIHEKFRDQTHMNNDIALIVLKNPVRFNDYIQPVCLPEKGDKLQPNRQCTISGWGSIKSGISTPSNILRAAQVPILPDETCKQPHVYGASLTEGMFCAGSMDESVDACDGDSGGPLVCSDDGGETLHGIISWGQHCGYANKPGVYVRIEKYIDWIYEKINFSLQQNAKSN